MVDDQTFRRGDVISVPFPYISDYTQSKSRPAVIIQNDVANQFSPNVIVALISSTVPSKQYPMHYMVTAESRIGRAAGLTRDSIIKAEVIITVPKKTVIQKLGTFSPEAMKQINDCLKVSLAL